MACDNFNEDQPCVCLQLIHSGIDSYENQTTVTTAKSRKCSSEQTVCCRNFHCPKLAAFKSLMFYLGHKIIIFNSSSMSLVTH